MPEDYEEDLDSEEPKKRSWLGQKLEAAGDKYKDWKAKAPKRRQKKIERLHDELEIQELRDRISESRYNIGSRRTDLQLKRTKLMERRQRTIPQMPSLMGSTMGHRPQAPLGTPSIFTGQPFAELRSAEPKHLKYPKRRKQKSKNKRKKK